MPRFDVNRARQQVGGTLRPRSRRSGSGQVHSLWQGVSAPNAPTNLAIVSVTATQAVISFTAPTDDGGSAITNYQFSTNGGSTWTAFSPADAISPVTITGLAQATTYSVALRAVNDAGEGTPSANLSVTTWSPTVATGGTVTDISQSGRTWRVHTFTGNGTFTVTSVGTEPALQYLVQAGGGGGGRYSGGGGGGGLVQTGEASVSAWNASVRSFTVTIGGGGASDSTNGGNSTIQDVFTSSGGGRSVSNVGGFSGGCGGGRQYNFAQTGSGIAGPPRQGFDGGYGGGGTAAAASTGNTVGGAGRSTTIRGTTEHFGGGGGSSGYGTGLGSGGGGIGGGGNGSMGGSSAVHGAANTGGGGASQVNSPFGGNGGSGIVIIRYPITV